MESESESVRTIATDNGTHKHTHTQRAHSRQWTSKRAERAHTFLYLVLHFTPFQLLYSAILFSVHFFLLAFLLAHRRAALL